MEPGYFTESDSAEVVIARNAGAKSERLKQVMAVITRHLHAAVREIEPTTDEWKQAFQFLTQTGQICNEWRQEYILFSDNLGVSMLVDAINNRKPSGASESTVLGPFHVADAPELPMGADICLDAKGEPMLVRGRILDAKGAPIDHARIDVWQANDEGFYDVQQKGIQPDFNLRGVFRTGPDGRYWFRKVKPKFHPIPDDGPVVKLLGALGRHPCRPAHLHYIPDAQGFETLVTHIFDPDDPHIDSDAVFGVKKACWRNSTGSPTRRGLPQKACPARSIWSNTISFWPRNSAMTPCILCVAITGSLPTKENNPVVPISIAEQIDSTAEAFEADASIAHCHGRDDAGKPTSDPDRFAWLMEGLRQHCPGMIIQLSTAGRSGAGAARGGMLPVRADMASLPVGSNNFPTRVFVNPPDLVDRLASEMLKYGVKPKIEAFDLSHIVQAATMARDGRLKSPLYVQFVMGVKNAMPADVRIFDFYIETLNRLAPGSLWCAAGIGAAQGTINDWVIKKGGHTRTGLADNVRLDGDRLAPSNAALVRRAGEICHAHQRPVATWSEARMMPGLSQPWFPGQPHLTLPAGLPENRAASSCGRAPLLTLRTRENRPPPLSFRRKYPIPPSNLRHGGHCAAPHLRVIQTHIIKQARKVRRPMVTLKQIASAVGVSQATVSRVLNFDATLSVSAQTRQAIIETAEAMNYATPRARQRARADQGEVPTKIALAHFLRPDQELADPYYVGLRLGIESRCAALRLEAIKIYHSETPLDPKVLAQTAGLICIGLHEQDELDWLKSQARHVVCADFFPADEELDAVGSDRAGAMRKLVASLSDAGYRRIGFVGWWDRNRHGQITGRETRCNAYIEWMQAAGLYDPEICQVDYNTEVSGYRLTQSVLSRPNRPDALICGNDNMAVGAYRAIHELGLRIPQDIAVASFNDISVAQFLNPPLSTVHLPAEEIGETAVDMLMERIAGRTTPKRTTLAARMIWRGSAKPNAPV